MSKRRPHNTGFLVQKAVVWVRAKRGVDFEAATTVPRERERARDRISRLFLFFLLLESALFVSLSEGVRGKRRCARALGSSSTSRRRAMMTKTVWATEIGTISERNNMWSLSSSFFFLSSFLRRLVVTSSVKRHSSSSLFFVFFRSNKGDDDVEE